MTLEYIPSHLSVYTTTKAPNEEVNQEGSAENWVSYKLSCPCGCGFFDVLVRKSDNEKYYLDPAYTVCTERGKRELLFDARQHGYEAQVGCAPDLGEPGEELVWECPNCHSPGNVSITLEYNCELEDEVEEIEELSHLKLEDCFAWIFINHLCKSDHCIHEIANFETM